MYGGAEGCRLLHPLKYAAFGFADRKRCMKSDPLVQVKFCFSKCEADEYNKAFEAWEKGE
jgi:hypothetical protein